MVLHRFSTRKKLHNMTTIDDIIIMFLYIKYIHKKWGTFLFKIIVFEGWPPEIKKTQKHRNFCLPDTVSLNESILCDRNLLLPSFLLPTLRFQKKLFSLSTYQVR